MFVAFSLHVNWKTNWNLVKDSFKKNMLIKLTWNKLGFNVRRIEEISWGIYLCFRIFLPCLRHREVRAPYQFRGWFCSCVLKNSQHLEFSVHTLRALDVNGPSRTSQSTAAWPNGKLGLSPVKINGADKRSSLYRPSSIPQERTSLNLPNKQIPQRKLIIWHPHAVISVNILGTALQQMLTSR